jgi:flavodoxin
MKSLIVLVSYHHKNTQKIAEVMAKVLDAQIKTPRQTSPEELQQYDLVGFWVRGICWETPRKSA